MYVICPKRKTCAVMVLSNMDQLDLPGRPAGPAATRPTGLTDACINNNNNNNNNESIGRLSDGILT